MRTWTCLLLALGSPAWADQITLDSGAIVEGNLAAWQQGGECWIHLSDGALAGTTLVVDCARVLRFERAPASLVNAPAVTIPNEAPLPVEVLADPAPPVTPPAASPITEAPGARVPVAPIDAVQTEPPAA